MINNLKKYDDIIVLSKKNLYPLEIQTDSFRSEMTYLGSDSTEKSRVRIVRGTGKKYNEILMAKI